jgi:glycosyltransferase involved in cell wall biosynthesis
MSVRGQDVSLVVYASPVGRARLRKLATDGMTFLCIKDQVPREELIQALRECTAVVVPFSSGVTVVPIKAIEAMAVGAPVIVANPWDLKIFRDGETCIVVSSDTPRGWQEAIMRAVDPKYRLSVIRTARAEAEAFRSSQNVEVILGILEIDVLPRHTAEETGALDL